METQYSHLSSIARLIQEVTSEAMCIVSSEGEIQFCNQPMARVFDYSTTNEMLHLPYHQLYADQEQFNFLSTKIEREGALNHDRVMFAKKEGDFFWGRITCRKLTHDDRDFYYITLKDLSARIRKEESAVKRMQELEKVNAQFDRFIYSASHDLRAPISSIMGLVQLMKIDREQEKQDQMILLMEKSLDKLDNVIRKLTHFNRNKTAHLKKTKINFKRIISRIQEKMMAHVYFSQVEFTAHDRLSGPFYSNHFRLELILEEIIRNAYDFLDYSKPSPSIFVDVCEEHGGVQIIVEDNGVGIPKEYVNRVFEVFFKASDRSAGSGIGLFVAREAVHKLNGSISLNSELGKGTIVTLTLPFQKK